MRISDGELEAMEPVQAMCTDAELIVTLANGQKVVTPLWWYPRLLDATPEQRAKLRAVPLWRALARCRRGSEHRRHARRQQGARRQAAGAGVTMRRGSILRHAARAAGHDRAHPDPRLRRPVHPADRAARARERGLLRDPAVHRGRRRDPRLRAQGDHPLGRPGLDHRGRGAARAGRGVRARRADPRHLLRRADDLRAARRQGRDRPPPRVRPRLHRRDRAAAPCSRACSSPARASRSG